MHVESTPAVSQSLMRPSVCETVGINVHGLLLSVLGSPVIWHRPPQMQGRKVPVSFCLETSTSCLPLFHRSRSLPVLPRRWGRATDGVSVSLNIPESLIPVGGQCLCLNL